MGYRALLFCPDEKTAHTVTLILNELEFAVESCAEPFAAVKKLVGEHFDGVVVDCDNEQNATLLFKSARQSATNQAALAVAIVEGQAGVAKAFRIGANLVLTKPINVEQSKGTLRVARGLLRKGESAKPLVHAENIPAAAPITSAASRPTKPSTTIPQRAPAPPTASQRPSAPAVPAPWGNRIAAPVAHASAQDSAESKIDSSKSIDETVLDLADVAMEPQSRATSASASTSTAAKGSTPQSSRPPSSRAASSPTSSPTSSPAAAASAAASARIPQEPATHAKSAEPLLSKIARTVNPIGDLPKTGEAQAPVVAAAKASSSVSLEFEDSQLNSEAFSTPEIEQKTEATSQPQSGTSASRKVLLALVVIVLLGVAVYLGWNQLHGKMNSGSVIGSVIAPTARPSPPPRSMQPANASVQPPSVSPVPSSASLQDSQPSDRASQTASNRDQDGSGSDSASDASALAPSHKVSAGSGAQPLVVKSGKAKAAKHAASDTAAPNVVVSADNSSGVLPNLIDVSTKSTPVLQTLAVSQGVSQGLIVKRIQPTYPDSALRLHLEGSVQLMATVGKNGNITAVKTLSGEPLLAQAATVAVKQWKYKPYLLDGQPVEIQTQVTINFKLPR
jgi:TonB family protein